MSEAPWPEGPLVNVAIAYLNGAPSGCDRADLHRQAKATLRRAACDGVPLKLFVAEVGRESAAEGFGYALERLLRDARSRPGGRVLYVASLCDLATCPRGRQAALDAIFAAGFELRAPCGRISPNGRPAVAVRAALARRRHPAPPRRSTSHPVDLTPPHGADV